MCRPREIHHKATRILSPGFIRKAMFITSVPTNQEIRMNLNVLFNVLVFRTRNRC